MTATVTPPVVPDEIAEAIAASGAPAECRTQRGHCEDLSGEALLDAAPFALAPKRVPGTSRC